MVSIDLIKELREFTGISISECKKALEEAEGDMEKAKKLLREWGREVAEKKGEREVGEGLIVSYVHGTGRVASLVAVKCETDFVARSEDFKNLCHELALQIAFMDAKNVDEFLLQDYIKDSGKKVKDIIQEVIAKLGENIVVERFVRFHI
jgi:elongation factor Ts